MGRRAMSCGSVWPHVDLCGPLYPLERRPTALIIKLYDYTCWNVRR